MKKIIFFDIDGTLIDFGKNKMSENTIMALQQLRANGILIGIATGRQTSVYKKIFAEITPMDFVIGSNGREVIVDDKIIMRETISRADLIRLAEFDAKYQVGLYLATSEISACITTPTPKCINYLSNLQIPLPEVAADFVYRDDIVQAMIYCDQDTENIFRKSFPSLTFVRHNNDGIDIITSGPMKEKGVDVVLQHYNLTTADALAFGDGLNDVGMFEHIDGVCLGIAHPELIKVAIKQIDTVACDGLYYYLKDNKYI